jgi:3-hydroxyisobutyrate dehydrogenase
MSPPAPAATVAFLGTGVMGAPMARNLARAGLAVTAWNRTAAKAEALAGDGVRAAPTPADAAAGADVLVTMLADAGAIEAAAGGADGALAALDADAVWVQMSTVGAPGAERLGALAAEHGVTYVDAPVLGSRGPAEAGELVILASGPEDARGRCAAVFDAVGRRTAWIGPAGAGSRLKVVVNAWLMSTTAALAETLALAERIGVDPADFLDVTDRGAIGALYTSANAPAMAAREFPTNFPLELAAKDARLALEAAGDGAETLRVLAATHAQFASAVDQGHGADDWAAVIYAALAEG